jgi:transcription elongation factor Elf1
MAGEASKGDSGTKKQSPAEVTFKCRLCGAQKPISEMKVITRFKPVIVVCQDCEKIVR